MKIKVFLLVLCLVLSVGFVQAQACETLTYHNASNDTFECMKSQLIDYGIFVPPGNSGKLSGHGITAQFVLDEESKLTIQIIEKPRIVSCRTAENEIGKFVNRCQSTKEK